MANASMIAATNTMGVPIMSPYELINGMETIKNNRLTNALTMRKLEQEQRNQPYVDQELQANSEKSKLENAIQRGTYVAQSVQGFLDHPVTPETQAAWQQTRAQIIQDVGHDIPNLPEQFDPNTLRSVYSQGMSTVKNLADRYKLISTTTGFKRVDMLNNQAEDIGGQQLMAPNADPYLAGQMQQQKEMFKGVDVTDQEGAQYRAPQWQSNQNFGTPSNNPGNIRPTGQTQGFRQFDNPEQGLSAIDQNLQAYAGHGINTLADVISRWSPPNENNTEQLIANASKMLGIHPYQKIDLNNPSVRHLVSAAIVRQENPVFQQSGIVKSPTIAQKKQIEANIDIDKESKIVDIKNQGELSKQQSVKIRDSKEALNLLNNIDRLLPTSTGSGIGSAADKAAAYFGKATEGAKSIAAIATDAKKLVMMMPRGAGPQSDRDVALAEDMSGRLSDSSLPIETRKAALEELKRITSQYIPGAEVPQGYSPGQKYGNKPSSNNDDIDSLVNKYLGGQ
jgi:hypothetical protein